MSQNESGRVEYSSPEEEVSDEGDASSAIGPVLEGTTSSSAVNLPGELHKRETTEEESMDSLAIGPVVETPTPSSTLDSTSSQTTEKIGNGEEAQQRPASDDESEDADEEQSSGDHDEEDEEEDEEEEEESDEEEEEEPVLKYSKIEEAAANILEKDTASAIAVGDTYFAVGTHNGLVHLFSIRGSLLKSYRPHSASVTDITISTSTGTQPAPSATSSSKPAPDNSDTLISDTIATTSLDGHAILHTLRNGSSTGHNFKRPLRSIALDPAYAASTTKSYVTGGMAGDLILSSRAPTFTQSIGLGNVESILSFGMLGHSNDAANAGHGSQVHKTLHSGDGPIYLVRWNGDIIAWAVDAGVRLYSVSKGEKIAFVERSRESPRADLFQCSLTWGIKHSIPQSGTQQELLIGWADLIKVLRITTKPRVSTSTGGGGLGHAAAGVSGMAVLGPAAVDAGYETVVEATKVLRLDCMIAGAVYWPFVETEPPKKHDSDHAKPEPTAVPTAATTAPISKSTQGSGSTSVKSHHKHPHHTHFLLLSYLPTKAMLSTENTDTRRQNANPPELRIIDGSTGEEKSQDVLALRGSERWGCSDYRIVESFRPPTSVTATSTVGRKGRTSGAGSLKEKNHGGWLVLSPKGVVLVRKRDRRDRVMWLVERERYEEALDEMEKMEQDGEFVKAAVATADEKNPQTTTMTKEEIGLMYLDHLFKLRQYDKAAKLCPKVLGSDAKAWEDWIFKFASSQELSVLVPYVPFKTPRLSKIAYGIILAYYLAHDVPALSRSIKEWSSEIYDIPSLINAIPQPPTNVMLAECLADLYIKNRQPGKALPYYLQLRRPEVFQLIKDNNLFTDVQDQALLLVQFDQELIAERDHLEASRAKPEVARVEKTRNAATKGPPSGSSPPSSHGAGGGMFSALMAGMSAAIPSNLLGSSGKPIKPSAGVSGRANLTSTRSRPPLGANASSFWMSSRVDDDDTPESRRHARGQAIPLLVDNSHSIPIRKVMQQLDPKPYFLYLYLDALFERDPELSAPFLEKQVELYAEYAPGRVIRLLQTSQNLSIDVSFEQILAICEKKDLVPEMVWIKSRMGNNREALYLIIDRLGDVERAIDFAKKINDNALWDDFLTYSETRPIFIKGLLENVSTDIDPIRIIRRIRNGLEIPGMKQSLIKILQDFNLQTSLMEGCSSVLESDCAEFTSRLQRAQVGGFSSHPAALCPICRKPFQHAHQDLILVFLCGHMVHAHCTSGGEDLPKQMESSLVLSGGRDLGAKIAYAEMVKRRLDQGCPVHQKLEQGDSTIIAPPPLLSHHSHSRKPRP